ncbi:hypothetical protein BDW22DRAFT_1354132 [Trametopsis cervina]|nr:hypothetical protein BDW22DRAFT_1354132 [Trametopsis cervina]
MPRGSKLRNLISRYLMGDKNRRKRLTREFTPTDLYMTPPPPPPPKDASFPGSEEVDAGVKREYITHSIFLTQDKSTFSWAPPPTSRQTMQTPAKTTTPPVFPPSPKRSDLPQMLSPAELRRRREQIQRGSQEPDPLETTREEARRQERLRMEKEAAEQQLEMEEERRRLLLEEDLRLAAVLRKQKEERERREEEERHQKIEERRRADRERRMRQAQKQNEWRLEQARQADESLRRKIELRTHVHEDRRMRSWSSDQSGLADESHEDIFHCWVTVQKCDNVAWKRRFCRVLGTQLSLFRDPASSQPMEVINITSARGLHEHTDGREELEGLAHAFALDIKEGLSYILITDNDKDKETLASLIVQTSGI